MRSALAILVLFLGTHSAAPQTRLSVHWEELTAEDFRAAIQQSQGTCLLPFGILEKHGPHMPLGTDLLDVRHAALTAAQQEWDRDDTGSIHVNSVLGTNRVNTLRLSLTREDDRFAPNGFPACKRRSNSATCSTIRSNRPRTVSDTL